jgi:hypothetical protein
MEEVKETNARKNAEPNKIMVQGLVDRDIYFPFRDLVKSHKLTMAAGLGWAMRSLLTQAAIKVRADRGTREQPASRSTGRAEEAVTK